MPTNSLRRLKLFVLGLITVVSLRAQVDSNLATATDILDVYKSGSVKPEIITMFDFSGSMSAVFWHYKYWTASGYNTHLTSITQGDNDDQVFQVTTSTNTVTITPYTGNTSTNLGTISGYLVKYDGTQLAAPLTLPSILTATHARLTWTKTFSGVSYTRTVDVPFPWTNHKSPTVAPTSTNLGTPTFIDCVVDPDIGSTNNYIAFDTGYKTYTTITNLVSAINSTSNPLIKYNTDYLYWIFWGTDTKGASGNDNTGGATGIYTDDAGKYLAAGKFIIPGSAAASGNAQAFANGLPTGTRASTLKKAVLSAWFGNRDSVWWAYRFLDTGETSVKSTNYLTWGTHTNRELTLFKKALSSGASDVSVTNFQSRTPSGGTPLTWAMANCLAQMAETGTSIFDAASTAKTVPPSGLGPGENPPPCRSSWIILFTDGIANESPMPRSGGGAWTTELGIQTDLGPGTYTNLDSASGTNWNIWSLAAVAAHGKGTALTTSNSSGTTPSAFAPFRVTGRNASPARKITTMTVGLCLSGTNLDGAKGPLLKAALFGDPNTGGYDINTAVAYGITTGGAQTNFFDATSPAKLVTALNTIMARVVSGNSGITAPSAPLVGLSLGTRAFLGRFETSNDKQGGGSIWKGDLLMAGLGLLPDGTVGLKSSDGNWATDINASNAVASAYNTLSSSAYPWASRKIYTVIPGSEPTLGGAALDLTAADQRFSESNSKLTNIVMGTPDAQSARTLIRFLQGAGPTAQVDTATPTTKLAKRTDLMGDIVNSSPAAVEYDVSNPLTSPLTGALLTEWNGSYATGKPYATDARFHVVFVGDNQGLFHAFGVVSGLDSSVSPPVLHAKMEELWAFVPSEFLNPPAGPNVTKLSQLQSGDPTLHLYTVDGSPVIYFNDAPISGGVGNFKVDSADSVRVIVGLRKGGRSYYAFDVLNPYAPKLAWVVNPNTSSDPTIKSMGLATSNIGLAEVDDPLSVSGYKDLVILGGGYSDNLLDARSIAGNPAKKLGRSLLALNVLDGTLVKKYDFVNNPTLAASFPNIGAITAGGFPFQFLSGSGRAQRVYFGDQFGGVYALGSTKKLTTAPVGWRVDSSNIDQWTVDGSSDGGVIPANPGIRWIYKGATQLSSGLVTQASPITSPPVAFRVPRAIPEFRRPATSTNAPNMVPPVVGVTFGTGDRNDPMDLDTTNPVGSASLRQVMVFDRQDSADLPGPLPTTVDTSTGAITDALLSDQTGTSTVGTTSYLGINQYLGYYLKLGGPNIDPNLSTHYLYPKAYLSPLVINGGLVFSSFVPATTGSSTSCAGSGTTITYRMCDALAPVFANGAKATSSDRSAASCSGYVFQWANLAGDLTAVGSRLILQSGQEPGAASGDGTGNVKIGSYSMPGGTTAFAPRSWRIVR
jgi:hypothetical protein